jgi:lysophospholipase L1-like esterase
MGVFGDLFRDVYRKYVTPNDPLSGAHKPAKESIWGIGDDIDDKFTEINGAIEAATEGLTQKGTWAELSAIVGTRNGQPGRVTGPDAGTHTDPVVGGTVANKGEYEWSTNSPGGWKWLRNLLDPLDYAADTPTTITGTAIDELTTPAGVKGAIEDRIEDVDLGTEDHAQIVDVDGNVLAYLDRLLRWHAKGFGFGDVEAVYPADTAGNERILVTDEYGDVLVAINADGSFEAVGITDGGSTTVEAEHKQSFGLERLRETHMRLMALALGETQQLTVASIGDSWTHSAARWTGPAATYMASKFGDAGPGVISFGAYDTGSGFLENGNVRPSLYTCTRSGAWDLSTYNEADTADLSLIKSSTALSKVTLGGPDASLISSAVLHWIGTADGVTRYRWNAGSWTTRNVQGSGLQTGTLDINKPSSSAWTLEIEVVSGSCWLNLVDLKSTFDGVRWLKLGATGSRAYQWAGVTASNWQAAMTALAPNLIVIMLGTNDQGSNRTPQEFATDLLTIVDRARIACPTVDILVMMPAENQRDNAVPMADYEAAAYDACMQRDVGYLNAQLYFGVNALDYAHNSSRPWFTDDGSDGSVLNDVHPDPLTGGRALLRAFLDATGVPAI